MKTSVQRVRDYRDHHKRIDYYPSPDVSEIIKYHQENSGEPCAAGVIDDLIRAGHRAVTGNGEN